MVVRLLVALSFVGIYVFGAVLYAGPDEGVSVERRRQLDEIAGAEDRVLASMLNSADELAVAWASSVIRSERRVQLRPLVQAAILRAPGLSSITAHQLLHCALEVGCEVPLSVALHFVRVGPDWCRVPAVLAATKLTDQEALELWDRMAGERISLDAVTVGVRLAAAGSPGFVKRLLATLKFTLVASVSDEEPADTLLVPPGGEVPGDGLLDLDPRFPPFIEHRLSLSPAEGSTVCVGKPIPVYLKLATRSEVHVGTGLTASQDGQMTRRELLCFMLGKDGERCSVSPGRSIRFRWTTAEQFSHEIRAGQRTLESEYWRLVAVSLLRGHLSRDDASTLYPLINVEVFDTRDSPSPLPAAPKLTMENPYRQPPR